MVVKCGCRPCSTCQEPESLGGQEIKNILVITFAFQAVFTAFNALQNLHSSLHDEEGLGLVSLSIVYGTGILSSFLAPIVIGLIGAKAVLVMSFITHCVYIVANIYPSFTSMAPAAVALGVFHGPAWTSQALYISACAFSYSKSSSASPYSILSRFNGLFFGIFATTQVVGNLVTSVVIRDGVGNTDEIYIFKYCGANDCPFLENGTEIEDPEAWVIDITLGFYLACAVVGLLLTVVLLVPLPRSDWIQKVPVRSTATSCFNVLLTPNMILLVPFAIFTAMEHALLLATYTKSYIACPIGIHMVGYVMAAYGGTTPAFMLIFTRVARLTGRFILIILALAIHLVIFIVLFLWSPSSDDVALIFIIPMIWGVSESILQAQANSLVAMLFPYQKEPAFANFHAWRNFGYTLTFLTSIYLCVSTKLIIGIICLLLSMVCYFIVEIRIKSQEKHDRQARLSVTSVTVQAEDVQRRKRSNSNKVRKPSKLSAEDRLSFDRVELADIIREAQMGWRRDKTGLTLEITKVMSKQYLLDSKVTTWYHTRSFELDKNVHLMSTMKRSLSTNNIITRTGRSNPRRAMIKSEGFEEPYHIECISESPYEDAVFIEDEENSVSDESGQINLGDDGYVTDIKAKDVTSETTPSDDSILTNKSKTEEMKDQKPKNRNFLRRFSENIPSLRSLMQSDNSLNIDNKTDSKPTKNQRMDLNTRRYSENVPSFRSLTDSDPTFTTSTGHLEHTKTKDRDEQSMTYKMEERKEKGSKSVTYNRRFSDFNLSDGRFDCGNKLGDIDKMGPSGKQFMYNNKRRFSENVPSLNKLTHHSLNISTNLSGSDSKLGDIAETARIDKPFVYSNKSHFRENIPPFHERGQLLNISSVVSVLGNESGENTDTKASGEQQMKSKSTKNTERKEEPGNDRKFLRRFSENIPSLRRLIKNGHNFNTPTNLSSQESDSKGIEDTVSEVDGFDDVFLNGHTVHQYDYGSNGTARRCSTTGYEKPSVQNKHFSNAWRKKHNLPAVSFRVNNEMVTVQDGVKPSPKKRFNLKSALRTKSHSSKSKIKEIPEPIGDESDQETEDGLKKVVDDDSDGFVDDEELEEEEESDDSDDVNVTYKPNRRRSLVPISNSEDVSNIY